MKAKRDFTSGPLFGKMILFTIPIILTGLLQLCYNMADNIVVGKFSGDEFALAAVGATGSLTGLVTNVFMGIGAGAGIVVAHSYGAKDYERVSRAVHTSITFSSIAGIAFGVILFFVAEPALTLMKINPVFIDKSILYVRILAFGIPASSIYNYSAAILRNVGDSRTPLIILSSSGLLNVALNLFFVIVCHMTVGGVALATVASQYASAVAVILVLILRKNTCYAFSFKKMRIDLPILKRSLRLGIPQGIQSSMFSISNVLLVSSMSGFNEFVFTGYTITNNIDAIVYHVCAGYSTTCLTFTAQNYGVKNRKRIHKVLLYSLIQVILVGFIVGQFVLIFNQPLAMLFMPDDATNVNVILEVVKDLSTLLLTTYFLFGVLSVLSGCLRGIGYSILQMVMYVIGLCGSRIIWIFFVFPFIDSPIWLMVCYPVSWLTTILMLGISRLIAEKKLKVKLSNPPAPQVKLNVNTETRKK